MRVWQPISHLLIELSALAELDVVCPTAVLLYWEGRRGCAGAIDATGLYKLLGYLRI